MHNQNAILHKIVYIIKYIGNNLYIYKKCFSRWNSTSIFIFKSSSIKSGAKAFGIGNCFKGQLRSHGNC